MSMEIIMDVSPEIAKAFNDSSEEKRRVALVMAQIELMRSLGIKVDKETANKRMWETIEKASAEAKKNGLTEEILNDILNEE